MQSKIMDTLLIPRPLKKGDSVALIAPSSPPAPGILRRAVMSIKALGLEPRLFPSCVENYGYLAGNDTLRARDIENAFADQNLSGVICLRGGYGTPRLLNLLNYDIIRNNPKRFFGYSDITALHTVFNQECGFVTFHAPMPSIDYSTLDDFTLSSLYFAMFGDTCDMKNRNPQYSSTADNFELNSICGGIACGTLAGGNLSLLVSTLGSPYAFNGDGKIIFIEEINEPPYKIDRMLTSLMLAGVFSHAQGILLGSFKDCRGICLPDNPSCTAAPDTNASSLLNTFKEVLSPLGIPVLAGLACGHSYPQLTLPLGCKIIMNTDRKTIEII